MKRTSETQKREDSSFYFLTPVWGTEYTRLFVDAAIPAQLAESNLGAFRDVPGCRYLIYTTPQDADFIRSSPIFEQLNSYVPVTFEWIDKEFDVAHDRMSACYRRGIQAANDANAGIIFLTPDIVFADGSFATLKRVASSGHDVIFVPAIRTLKPGVEQALLKYTKKLVIKVQPRELMRIALDNLHPLADSSWWNKGDTDLLPANLYWPVGNEGVLGRCFHLHPIYVRPQRKDAVFFGTVDDDFCTVACPNANRDYVMTDSDEFLSIELSGLSHFFRTNFRKGSVDDAASWAEQFTSARHRLLFNYVVRMHTGIRDHQAWSGAEREAETVATAIKERLNISTFHLLLKNRLDIVARRLVRVNLDSRLEATNQSISLQSGHTAFGLMNFHQFMTYAEYYTAFALMNFYQFTIRSALKRRQWFHGTTDRPRRFTLNYLVRDRLYADLLQLVGSASDILLISANPKESVVRSILTQAHLKVADANYSQATNQIYLSSDTRSDRIPHGSCDVIIVEPEFGNHLKTIMEAAHGMLDCPGRVIIISGRLASRTTLNEPCARERAEIAPLLPGGYVITEYRRVGGSGSSIFYALDHGVKRRARRHPIASLMAIVFLPFIWFPLLLMVYAFAAFFAKLADRLDRTKRSCLCSLTVAARVS